MAILSSELKLYKSAVINDLTTNGGRRSNTEVISGLLGNGFDHVLPEERVAGSDKIRKFFYSVRNDDDLPLYAAKLFLDAPTPGDDWVTLFSGTARDTVASHSSPRRYGSAFLTANASPGAATLVVTAESTTITGMFVDGDEIVVTDKLTPTASAGNREIHTISGVPVVVGVEVTITIAGTLAHGYTTANAARVASILPGGDISCSADNWVETGSGTYDETTYPLTLDNLGTIEQTWTLTFSDATTFSLVGDVVGAVGSGVVGSNFAPVNPATGKPYLALAAAGWGGTWTAGNTIVFQTHGAELGLYLNRVVPAGAAAGAGNRVTPVLLGATA